MNNHSEKKTATNGKRPFFTRMLQTGTFVLVMSLIISCQSNQPPKDNTPPAYTPLQQLFCLNILSNISAHYNYHSGDTILDSTIYAIDTVLGNASVQQLIGRWKCVWGPGVFTNTDDVNLKPIAANTLYIVQNLDTPSVYVVAIAGTDPASISDWMGEDADVMRIRSWDTVLAHLDTGTASFNKLVALHPFISDATNLGLFQIMNLTDTRQPAGQQLASDFLSRLIANASSPITIWTTGHSLGGALSPTLALYLNDKWAGSNANVAIGCLAVAGATPGNGFFADRFNSELGSHFIRVWNQQDVVPHGYASGMLQRPPYLREVDTIYNRAGIQTPDTSDINRLATLLTPYLYTQLQNTNTGFASAFYDTTLMLPGNTLKPTSFIGQLTCQHIPSYAAYFNIGSFQTSMQQVLGLPYPFFSQGFNPAQITYKGNYPVLSSLVLKK